MITKFHYKNDIMAKTSTEWVAEHHSKVYNDPEAYAKLKLKDRIRMQKRKQIKEGGLTAIKMRRKVSIRKNGKKDKESLNIQLKQLRITSH